MKIDIDKLFLILAQKEMSVGVFCEQAGITSNGLSKIRKGAKSRTETIGRIARILGIPVEELIKKE